MPNYRVNDTFESVQGEGSLVGTPSLFIRFSGCNLKCWWCDTDHESFVETNEVDIDDKIRDTSTNHIILTGGEPTLQNIEPLIERAIYYGKTVQVETNGTVLIPNYLDWEGKVFLTVSPKDPYYLQRWGHELKLVYNGSVGSDLPAYIRGTNFKHHFLQPMWRDGKMANLKDTLKAVMNNPEWRLSLQTHKLIGVL